MKLRPEHVDAAGGCEPCRQAAVPAPPDLEQASAAGPPGKSVVVVDPTKKSFIVFALVDRAGRPVPGAGFDLTLPDHSHVLGALDEAGKVRVEGIDPGTCSIAFPTIDRRDFG